MAGMSIRTAENLAKLAKYSVTQVSLGASRLNVGSMQFVTTGTLYCATGTSGLGGIATGESLTAGTLYYVYAVASSGQVYLVASTNASLPTGYTQARVVGGFTTNSSSQVDQAGEYPGNLAVAGSVSAGDGFLGQDTRNIILNGNFDFWQRVGSTQTANAVTGYYADRFNYVINMTTGRHTVGRSTDVPNGLSTYSLLFDCTAAQTSLSTEYTYFIYKVEGLDFQRLYGKPFTLSFWVKSTKTGIFCVSFRNSSASHSYVAEYTINGSDVWEKKTITVPFPTVGTWLYDNSIGMMISFTLARGGTVGGGQHASTANAWVAGSFISTANQSNQVDSSSNNFLISQVMLNVGTSAAPFQRAGGTIGGELALCQRYYSNSFALDNVPGVSVANNDSIHCTSWADGNCPGFWYPVPMRATPNSITLRAQASTVAGQVSVAGVSYSASASSISHTHCSYITTGGPAVGGNYVRFTWEVNAEL